MLFKTITVLMSATVIFVGIASTEVPDSKLSALIAMCDVNPDCSHVKLIGRSGVSFNIREKRQLTRVACQSDGSCIFAISSGKRALTDILYQPQ